MVGNIRDAFKRFLYALIGIGDEVYKRTEHMLSKMAALIGYPDGKPHSSELNDYYDELEYSKTTRFFRDWRTALELHARHLVRDQQHLRFLSLKVVAREMVQILGLQTFTREQGTIVWRNRSNVAEHFASIPRCLRKSLKEQLFHVNLASEPPDSENLADFGGLLVAHSEFTALPYDERTLSLHGRPLKADQIFYAFHCAKLCETDGKASSDSQQAAARLRCVMPLMNSEAFADVFHCPYSSPMNHAKKCSLL
ncbi:endothelin-converting enzyme 1-like [Rhipicephalus microplus]|uniref:endothelin-converting enzyme 1-like n=1 Tax=Rhipicephalus microplus TaxID=6941 RepID=UPI003F6D6A74